jgi:hypothetical protein
LPLGTSASERPRKVTDVTSRLPLFRNRKYKIALWFFRRPFLSLVVQFAVMAPLLLADDPMDAAGAYIFLLPWLLLLFSILNLPLVMAAFHAFRMDVSTRRNHALEHATIHYLEATGGRRLSGRAGPDGFHVFGRTSARDIRSAFDKVRRQLGDTSQLPYISRRCGSNKVTALGLTLLLLSVVVLASIIIRPPWPVRAGGLLVVILFFIVMRHGIGNWVQRRFFMRIDFHDVSLRDVREVQDTLLEKRPVHFVETIVHRA